MTDSIRLRGTFGQLMGVQPPPTDVPLRPDMPMAERLRLMRLGPAPADTVRLSSAGAGAASRTVPLTPVAAPGQGRQVADGVWYADDRRTRDGAPVRVLTVDPRRARIGALYTDGVTGMDPRTLQRHPQFVGAVNGTFFGAGVIGDMRGFGRTFLDESAPTGAQARAADQASDRRYYVGVLRDGQVVSGRGGLSESGLSDRLDSFQGGLGLLYTREQLPRLEADIASGAFADRIIFKRDQQEQSIARSFLGVAADGKVLMVTMGAGERRSDGAGFTEAARILRSLGAVEAYILDGGGSTAMSVRGVAETHTDGRQVKNYLAVFARQ
jgi:hypothetical protein